MNRIVHFEIPASDPEKSIKFYGDLFGWKFTRFGNEEYWLVETGQPDQPGINGGLMKRRDPAQPVTNTIEVANLDDTIKRIEAAGGKIVVPKMPIPGVGWLAFFTDPDGMIHGITKADPSAK